MIWVIVGLVVAALVAGVLYLRSRRKRQSRLISLVALTRNTAEFDPAILASQAGRAWNADLGDGSTEGSDGFVVTAGIVNTIVHDGHMVLLNSFPKPYVDDIDEAAEQIDDLRIRRLFGAHKAWFSCDALGVDGTTSDDEIRDWYRRLGHLLAELLDDDCLLIYVPDTSRAYPINEDTEAALRSSDPLAALQATLTVPFLAVPPDDPLMQEAETKAREAWPEFVTAYENGDGSGFAVKAPVQRGENTEYIWIAVTALEGGRIYGELANDPADLGPLTLGSKVSVEERELNDWCYVDPHDKLVGGYTIAVVQQASKRRRGGTV